MVETQKVNGGRAMKVPEFLREPIEAAQARFGHLEEEAERVLRDLMDVGRASRKELEQIVARFSKQDWTLPEVKHRIERLREQGAERAAEWRGRAEALRAEAKERVTDLQGRAIGFLGVASRDRVEELSREVGRLTKELEKRRARKARPSTEV